jgi:hypothetical protein
MMIIITSLAERRAQTKANTTKSKSLDFGKLKERIKPRIKNRQL